MCEKHSNQLPLAHVPTRDQAAIQARALTKNQTETFRFAG